MTLDVRKTYKLYVNGAFPRSESGRTYPVYDTRDRLVANAVLASRKDLRDATCRTVGVHGVGAATGWVTRRGHQVSGSRLHTTG